MLGRALYYITLPGIWLVVWLTPPRTRVVVICEDKVLLTKDWLGSGHWSLPGGGLRRNEPADIGAVRELAEETGVVANPHDLVQFLTLEPSGIKRVSRLICFRLELKTAPAISAHQVQILDCVWASPTQLDSMKVSGTSKKILAALRVD